MGLFQRRLRQRDKQERLASGEAIPWTTSLSKEVRTALLWAMSDASGSDWVNHAKNMRDWLAREWRVTAIREWDYNPASAISDYLLEDASDGDVLDMIEACLLTMELGDQWNTGKQQTDFKDAVNRIFDEDDIAYQLVGFEIVPRESMAMHANVITPALVLLHGTPGLENIEKSFRDALQELKPSGDPADAITDAGAALQEMLEALGAEGKSLGPLLNSAKVKGLLGPHDSKLADGAQKIGEWVSAERSTRGDTHGVSDATRDDAWLAVHVVGALIVRLERRLP